MAISNQQREMLFEAWDYCDTNDKSTEFMFQYMADTADVEYDEAVDFVVSTSFEKRQEWYRKREEAKEEE